MSHELPYEHKINHYSRMQARHKTRGINSMGGNGVRCIEAEVVAKWDNRRMENARQKGKIHRKSNGTKWKHAATRKMRHNKKFENFLE